MMLRNMKMKKIIIVLCCAIIASMGIVLTGCGNGSGEKKAESNTEKNVESSSEKNTESNSNKDAANLYVGTWESKIAECDGKEYDVKEIMGDFEVTFHADGTYSLLQDGNTTDGKWEPVDEGVKITENSGVEFSLTYQDEKLLMEITIGEISATYYFEKKK